MFIDNKMKKKIPLTMFLAGISILGFLAIVLEVFAGININPLVRALIFIIIGIGLATIGSILSTIKYLEDGLTDDEVTHIVTSLVGTSSIIVGILTLPIQAVAKFDVPAMDGIRGLVAIFAILFIVIEVYIAKR